MSSRDTVTFGEHTLMLEKICRWQYSKCADKTTIRMMDGGWLEIDGDQREPLLKAMSMGGERHDVRA